MNALSDVPQPLSEPGIASAEGGVVILDGPEGTALTLTPDAASRTGESLISAAAAAVRQALEARDKV